MYGRNHVPKIWQIPLGKIVRKWWTNVALVLTKYASDTTWENEGFLVKNCERIRPKNTADATWENEGLFFKNYERTGPKNIADTAWENCGKMVDQLFFISRWF